MAICHSLGVAMHESRDALQHDKQGHKIGLNIIMYGIKRIKTRFYKLQKVMCCGLDFSKKYSTLLKFWDFEDVFFSL